MSVLIRYYDVTNPKVKRTVEINEDGTQTAIIKLGLYFIENPSVVYFGENATEILRRELFPNVPFDTYIEKLIKPVKYFVINNNGDKEFIKNEDYDFEMAEMHRKISEFEDLLKTDWPIARFGLFNLVTFKTIPHGENYRYELVDMTKPPRYRYMDFYPKEGEYTKSEEWRLIDIPNHPIWHLRAENALIRGGEKGLKNLFEK